MLYKVGENLDATPESLAKGILDGELVVLSVSAAEAQQFLTAYRTAYSIPGKGVSYLAFSESELDTRFSAFNDIKQYKDFIVLDVGQIRTVLSLVPELEDAPNEEAGNSVWLADAASKADGSGE